MSAKKVIYGKLWDVNRMEKMFWRQKSKVLWLKEGDKILTFFTKWQMLGRKVTLFENQEESGIY